jgi:hypothetical protein
MVGRNVRLCIAGDLSDDGVHLQEEVDEVDRGHGRTRHCTWMPLHLFCQPVSPAVLQLRIHDWYVHFFLEKYISYIICAHLGIGVGLLRDPATLMLGQYFKGKRAHVEIILVAGSGLGLTTFSAFLQIGIT